MSHRHKILHIISSWESGVGNELAEFAHRLAREDFENEICVLTGQNRNVPNVPTTTLGLRWSFDVSTYLGVSRLLCRFRPDIVHVWDSTAQRYGTLHAGTHRVLAEKRESDTSSDWLQKYFDNKTYRFIAPHKIGDCPKTVIIPPAAVPVPSAKPMPPEELLQKLGFPLVEPSGDYYPVIQPQYDPARRNYKPMPPHSTPFLIGMVLPLESEHKILDALWAFQTLKQVNLNFHVFVIGAGKDQDMVLRYRDRWKLFSRVHFLGNRCDAARLLPCFDVLLHLSPSAEYSGTILSAMSCGVPVIALETPESREYVLDGTTGLLIPADGDFRFYRRTAAKKLLYLLENEELRRSMQRAAQDRAAKTFNFDAALQRRIDVYRAVMAGTENRELCWH